MRNNVKLTIIPYIITAIFVLLMIVAVISSTGANGEPTLLFNIGFFGFMVFLAGGIVSNLIYIVSSLREKKPGDASTCRSGLCFAAIDIVAAIVIAMMMLMGLGRYN